MKHNETEVALRAGEHAWTDRGQLIFFFAFFAVWVTDSFIFRYSMIASSYVPLYVRLPIGIFLIGLAVLFVYRSHKTIFDTPERLPGVVNTGMYRIVRHPMYFGSWLFFAGFSITTLSITSIALVLLLCFFYLYVARFEERYLETIYGEEYRNLKGKVPMFFPLLKRRKS